MKRIFVILLCAFCLILASCSKHSNDENEIIDKINSTLEIKIIDVSNNDIVSQGTCFCIGTNLFISAKHIFANYDSNNQAIVGESINGIEIKMKIKSESDKYDLITLESQEDTLIKAISLSSERENWLDEVYVIGNSRGLGLCINKCSISSPAKELSLDNNTYKVIQINGTINEGDSGGPLLNSKGELIGVISFKLSTSSGISISGMSFAISRECIRDYINNSSI